MTPPLYIAMRFLTHRKRALLLSLSGVVFGVAIFICTQAQTQGFTRYFIDSTIGSNGALVVKSRFRPLYEPLMVSAKASNGEVGRRQYFEGIANANEIMRISRQFSNVVSCSPVLRGTLTARAGFQNATIDLYGINPGLHAQTTDILQKLISGKYDDFRNNTSSIIIGSRLAEDLLHAGVGDTVQLLAPNGEYWRFTVAAIARAGIGSIDSTRIYCHARIAQALLQQPSGASMIIYKLRNPDRAPALAEHFEALFQHGATGWQDREESTLQLFLTLRMSVAITTSLILLLAGFGIFNVLTMSVLAKIKEIAILRSMGYRRIDVSSIFLWQGALIAAAGALIGCLLGALMTWGVSHIPIRLRGLLYTNHFLVTWDWRHYVFATLLALLAVFIASYVPARRAAELPPVVTIRGSR
ncbi:MAG: ABC transporter permease [Verrucomicrobia bacterium]|nr:MAG: ABC transporter permease [Verrucomicrobiota bacterium]